MRQILLGTTLAALGLVQPAMGQLQGACCDPSGTCAIEELSTCTINGGYFAGFTATCPDACAAITFGACCSPFLVDFECNSGTANEDCSFPGLVFGGEGTACAVEGQVSECAFVEIVLLPVELVSFDALAQEGGVVLVWETATETNNSGFEVEMASGSDHFQTIDFVEGAGTTVDAQG